MALRKWHCEIIIEDGGLELPPGFDFPPRRAAENVMECHGFEIILNASGWGQEIEDEERESIERWQANKRELE